MENYVPEVVRESTLFVFLFQSLDCGDAGGTALMGFNGDTVQSGIYVSSRSSDGISKFSF